MNPEIGHRCWCERCIILRELVQDGFRPGRSAHQALQNLNAACMRQRLRLVLDIDIEKYLDVASYYTFSFS